MAVPCSWSVVGQAWSFPPIAILGRSLSTYWRERPSNRDNVWVRGGQASRQAGPWTNIFGARRGACSSLCIASNAREGAQPLQRCVMKSYRLLLCPTLIALFWAAHVLAQAQPEQLGRVHFPVSCGAATQTK